MALRSSKSEFHKILLIIFGVSFGLVALAAVYKGVRDSSEIRSKAAEAQSIYVQWEFNGDTTEGWESRPPSAKVEGGMLKFSTDQSKNQKSFIEHTTVVSREIRSGARNIQFAFSASKSGACTGENCLETREVGNRQIPKPTGPTGSSGITGKVTPGASSGGFGTYTTGTTGVLVTGVTRKPTVSVTPSKTMSGSPSQNPVTINVYYRLSGKDSYEAPILVTGNAGPAKQVLTASLPTLGTMNISGIKIELTSGFTPGQKVSFDWIRVLGPVVTLTGTPKNTPFPTMESYGPFQVTVVIPQIPIVPGYNMSFHANVVERDGSQGTSDEGFAVSAIISQSDGVYVTPRVYGGYNTVMQWWDFTNVIAPWSIGKYTLHITAECKNSQTYCATQYGATAGVTHDYRFAVVPYPTRILSPKPTYYQQ